MATNNDFLNNLAGKSGVYFVSPELPTESSERFLVKIGMAADKTYLGSSTKKGMKARLESYLLYYPRGYNIFGLVLTNLKNAKKVESQIQSYLTGKGRKADFPHSRTEEWYWLSLGDIEKTIKILTKDNRSVLSYEIFKPHYVLLSNPGAGKQRHINPSQTPERRKVESRSRIEPPSTASKKRSSASRRLNLG